MRVADPAGVVDLLAAFASRAKECVCDRADKFLADDIAGALAFQRGNARSEHGAGRIACTYDKTADLCVADDLVCIFLERRPPRGRVVHVSAARRNLVPQVQACLDVGGRYTCAEGRAGAACRNTADDAAGHGWDGDGA